MKRYQVNHIKGIGQDKVVRDLGVHEAESARQACEDAIGEVAGALDSWSIIEQPYVAAGASCVYAIGYVRGRLSEFEAIEAYELKD